MIQKLTWDAEHLSRIELNSEFNETYKTNENNNDTSTSNDTRYLRISRALQGVNDNGSSSMSTKIADDAIKLFIRQQFDNFSKNIVNAFSNSVQLASNSPLTKTNLTSTILNQDEIIVDTTDITNFSLFVLIILYCIVILGGIFGNASLIITLFTQSSSRLRNPLLVALVLADLLVTSVAAPVTIITLAVIVTKFAITSQIVCRFIFFMQVSKKIFRT